MYLSIFDDVEKVTEEALKIEPASLYCVFDQVTDGRKARGKRYLLALLLTLLLVGKLAGETTVNGIVEWVKERQGRIRAQLTRYANNSKQPTDQIAGKEPDLVD